MTSDSYFGSRRLGAIDQLGSVGTYYPWGEAKGSTNPQDTWSYATYWRDSTTGLDYAQNRYYSNAYGRFTTPDPYMASGGPSDPQSWNRYAYTRGDPVNRVDPGGLLDDDIEYCDSVCQDAMSFWSQTGIQDGPSLGDICQWAGIAFQSDGGAWNPDCGTPPVSAVTLGDVEGLQTAGIISGWSATTSGWAFTLTPAEGAEIGAVCVAEPWVCVAVGGGLAIYVAYAYGPSFIQAIENAAENSKPSSWPACIPPVGTIGYRLDGPRSRPHAGMTTHVHLYKMNQNPNNGQCFWQSIGAQPPPPPPGAVPISPAAGGTNP